MPESDIIEEMSTSVPLYSLNVVDNEVLFKEPKHVPATIDYVIPMSYEMWLSMGMPRRIRITVEPLQ